MGVVRFVIWTVTRGSGGWAREGLLRQGWRGVLRGQRAEEGRWGDWGGVSKQVQVSAFGPRHCFSLLPGHRYTVDILMELAIFVTFLTKLTKPPSPQSNEIDKIFSKGTNKVLLGLATAMCAGNYVLCTNGRHKTKDENEQDQNNLKGYNKGIHASEYEQLK